MKRTEGQLRKIIKDAQKELDGMKAKKEKLLKKYVYIVDEVKYEVTEVDVTVAFIKSNIPQFDYDYDLYLEMPDRQPDKQLKDSEIIDLKNNEKVPRFYSIPRYISGG